MKKILYPLTVIWAWWYFIIFTLFFFIFYPLFAVFLSRPQWFRYANKLRVVWAYLLFFLTGIICRVERHSKLKKNQPYIFCSNHFSYLDIPVSTMAVKRNFCFVAKSEINNIPFLNIFFKKLDISMERENPRESLKGLSKAKEALENGLDVVIYPEGKIDDHPPLMAHFKNGPFKLAIENQIPIVPFSMIDNWKILYVNGWKMYGRPGIARAIVHEPIETKGMTLDNLQALKEKVFMIVDGDLRKHLGKNFKQA